MARQNDLLMDISILYRSTQKYYDGGYDKERSQKCSKIGQFRLCYYAVFNQR